jgi:tellurite resistance protein
MYLHLLEKDEKQHFLAFARHLAKVVDDKVDARERFMLKYMSAEMGIDADADAVPFDLEKLVIVFYRSVARRVLIMECVGIAMANGAMEDSERELLESVAARFFLPENFVARASDVVKRQLAVMEEFDQLVSAE